MLNERSRDNCQHAKNTGNEAISDFKIFVQKNCQRKKQGGRNKTDSQNRIQIHVSIIHKDGSTFKLS